MSQRLKAGLSWPGFPVSAGEPFDGAPWESDTIAARSAPGRRIASTIAPSCVLTPLLASAEVGVGQLANLATSFSGLALLPHRSSVAPFQSRADAVGQDESAAA